MAKELSRTHHSGKRTIIVKLEDEFGEEHHLQIFVGQDKCLACGTLMPGNPNIDVEDVVERTKAALDAETSKVKHHFSHSQKSDKS